MAKSINVLGGRNISNNVTIADDDAVSEDGLSVINRQGAIILEAPEGQRFVDRTAEAKLDSFERDGRLERPRDPGSSLDGETPAEPASHLPRTAGPAQAADAGIKPVLSRSQIRLAQISAATLWVLCVGGLAINRAFHPNPYDFQALADLTYHPIASALGALAPSVVLSPLAYWWSGVVIRRYARRFKICEHCASSIKADARVCRHCGRDVATSF
jgi:hypothetical protein